MKKVVLLAGQTGSSLTTLFNKITNSNLKTKFRGESLTLEAQVKDSQYGQGFTLIDTPGFGYDVNVNTIPTYLNLLENFEISRIMIVAVCYQDGLRIIRESCKDVLQAFQRYKDKITIVINFFGHQSDWRENIKIDIIQYFQKIGIQSLIFTSLQDSGEKLCELFDQEIKYSQPQKIKFTETEMLRLIKYDDLDEFYEIESQQFDLLASYYKTFSYLREVKIDSENQDKFLIMLKIAIKKIIDESYKAFSALDIHHKKEDQQSLLYQHFKLVLTDYLNAKIANWKQHKIELQNYIENELRPFDKQFEIGFQICLQKIRDNAKKKKINYL